MTTARVASTQMPAPRHRTFFGHPPALATLFSTELWERFSYYGMRAILVLYLAAPIARGGWGWSSGEANSLYGVYVGMGYLAALPGGWIADRVLGPRRSVLYGGIVIACGHYCLAIPAQATFFLGLLLIVLGTGMLKPNISAMVGTLYDKDSPKRDAGFSLFYMGINLGALIAPIVVGWLAQSFDWHVGFGAAGVGMTIAVIWYIAGGKVLGEVGRKVDHPLSAEERRRLGRWVLLAVVGLACAAGVAYVLGGLTVGNVVWFLTFVPIAVAAVYFARMFRDRGLSADEVSRVKAYVWLFVCAACFWLIYDQGGSVLNLFAERNTDLGPMPSAAWLQSVNPVFIIIGSPLAGIVWLKVGHRLGTPVKFAIGLLFNGLSYVVMAIPAAMAVGGVKVSWLWLVAVYAVQVSGELALSPVGLSATTKLAPASYGSQMLGLWFLATAVGDGLGGQVAKLTDVMSPSAYFLTLGIGSIVIAAGMFALNRWLRGLMRGIH